jgi:hypothetical protein
MTHQADICMGMNQQVQRNCKRIEKMGAFVIGYRRQVVQSQQELLHNVPQTQSKSKLNWRQLLSFCSLNSMLGLHQSFAAACADLIRLSLQLCCNSLRFSLLH